MRRTIKWTAFIYIISFYLYANVSFNIDVTMDKENYHIGDYINQHIKLSNFKQKQLPIASIIDIKQQNSLTFITKNIITKQNEVILLLSYTAYNLGTIYTPKITFSINNNQYTVNPISLNIISIFKEDEETAFIDKFKPQKEVKINILSYLLAIIIFTIIIVILYILLNKITDKKDLKEDIEIIDPYEEAISYLKSLKNLTREDCYNISETIKYYLNKKTGVDFLEKTTTEIKVIIDQTLLPKELIEKILIILNKLDVFKYTQAEGSVNEYRSLNENSQELITMVEASLSEEEENDT